MEKSYEITEEIGRGDYGVVWKAFNRKTGEIVAIKKLFKKYESFDECMNLVEVRALIKNYNHLNIVKFKNIFHEEGTLYLVFEYMQCTLYDLMVSKKFSETRIRNICFQIFQGLAYMHHNGYMHRDLKPENFLVNKKTVKICDLGQVRETNSTMSYDFVTSEWYRAPEVFLYSPTYSSAIDMWAMGAIMFELFTNKPLFGSPCESYYYVLDNMCSVLGTPTENTWSEGLELARDIHYEFPNFPGVCFSKLLPNASPDAVNLIATLLSWDPSLRPTAIQTLQHPFFHGYRIPKMHRELMKEKRI